MSSLTLTLVQPNLVWQNKAANLQMLEAIIKPLAGKTEVIILPEMFSTGFSMQPELLAETMDGPTINWMRTTSAKHKLIITGSLIIEDGGNYYNRLVWMLPNGHLGLYDKRHLFAYANEHEHYTAGSKRLIASVKGWKINLQVCYDLRFPVWARQQMNEDDVPEYDILVYVANWPEKRSEAWKTLLQARAIENQAYCIGVNRIGNDGNNIYHSGNSMIINPVGEVLYHCPHEEAAYTITLHKEILDRSRKTWPFLKDGDGFAILH